MTLEAWRMDTGHFFSEYFFLFAKENGAAEFLVGDEVIDKANARDGNEERRDQRAACVPDRCSHHGRSHKTTLAMSAKKPTTQPTAKPTTNDSGSMSTPLGRILCLSGVWSKRATGPSDTALQRCPVPYHDAVAVNRPSPCAGEKTLLPNRLTMIVQTHIPGVSNVRLS